MKGVWIMTPSERTNLSTIKEWRELGFFYDYDQKLKTWHIVGSRSGLMRFCDLLLSYSDNLKNNELSEHEHYGPYMYLEVMTSEKPGIDAHCIRGTLSDIRRLANLVSSRLREVREGDVFTIGKEYDERALSVISFELKDPDFDPASADPLLK
jgi:hypothetical protein